eukprot:2861191-Rhodomonas_salina.1
MHVHALTRDCQPYHTACSVSTEGFARAREAVNVGRKHLGQYQGHLPGLTGYLCRFQSTTATA